MRRSCVKSRSLSLSCIKSVLSKGVTLSSGCNCPGQTGEITAEGVLSESRCYLHFLHAPLNAVITSIAFQEPAQHSHRGELSLPPQQLPLSISHMCIEQANCMIFISHVLKRNKQTKNLSMCFMNLSVTSA